MTDEHTDVATLLGLLGDGADISRHCGRSDLARVLDIAAARIRRPATVVCVVGEYKQGKSHVINAVVGDDICAVDDDLATASITVIGHGDPPVAIVHRSEDGQQTTEQVPLADLPRYTAESEQGELPNGIDLVEVAVPSPALERGMAVVDTPGVNALGPGNDRAILDFLAFADALLLVTDASAELSPPEIRFLSAARERCPMVLVALSKIDLYPEWRRIAELDEAHLRALQLDGSLVPVSSTLRSLASRTGDETLDAESGYPDLLGTLERDVVAGARRRGSARARQELDAVLTTLRSAELAQLDALDDPEQAQRQLAELRRGRQAVARLREATAKWVTVLNDGITDVRSEVDYRLRTGMRRHLQETDRTIADGDPKSDWDVTVADLKNSLAVLADELFATVRDGAHRVAEDIGEMIAEDAPEWATTDAPPDIEELWSSADRDPGGDGPSPFSSGLTVLRGGYSGMLMLSMLAQMAGIAVLGPVSLGAGTLLGAKQFRDERHRQRERRRQEARIAIRQFLDQVQHELSTRTQRAIHDAQRGLRNHFTDRIAELSTRYTRATHVLERSIAADAEQRAGLVSACTARLARIEQLSATAGVGVAG